MIGKGIKEVHVIVEKEYGVHTRKFTRILNTCWWIKSCHVSYTSDYCPIYDEVRKCKECYWHREGECTWKPSPVSTFGIEETIAETIHKEDCMVVLVDWTGKKEEINLRKKEKKKIKKTEEDLEIEKLLKPVGFKKLYSRLRDEEGESFGVYGGSIKREYLVVGLFPRITENEKQYFPVVEAETEEEAYEIAEKIANGDGDVINLTVEKLSPAYWLVNWEVFD